MLHRARGGHSVWGSMSRVGRAKEEQWLLSGSFRSGLFLLFLARLSFSFEPVLAVQGLQAVGCWWYGNDFFTMARWRLIEQSVRRLTIRLWRRLERFTRSTNNRQVNSQQTTDKSTVNRQVNSQQTSQQSTNKSTIKSQGNRQKSSQQSTDKSKVESTVLQSIQSTVKSTVNSQVNSLQSAVKSTVYSQQSKVSRHGGETHWLKVNHNQRARNVRKVARGFYFEN